MFLLQVDVVERRNEDKHHLTIDLHDVVPDHEDNCSKLSCKTNSVLGVAFLLFVGVSRLDVFPVNKIGIK